MASEFGWGIVGAGFALGAFGGAQPLAQLAYARANRQDSRDTLGKLELAELAGILLLFGRAGAARGAWRRTLYVAAFLLGSATQYCANCLMSAPFNALLLAAGGGGGGGSGGAALDRKVILLASQYGIFLGFLVGPIAIRGAMDATAESQSVLAAVLVAGWGAQTLLNHHVLSSSATAIMTSAGGGGDASALPPPPAGRQWLVCVVVALLACAVLAWAMLACGVRPTQWEAPVKITLAALASTLCGFVVLHLCGAAASAAPPVPLEPLV